MNKERTIWTLAIILLIFYISNQSAKVNQLEILNENNQLSHRIQSDQISDMLVSYNELSMFEYKKGFEDGKNHALISVINDEDINSYKDGYHAGINSKEEQEIESLKKTISNSLSNN
jgi:hypothetical protein